MKILNRFSISISLCLCFSLQILNAQIDFTSEPFSGGGNDYLDVADINGDGILDVQTNSEWFEYSSDGTYTTNYIQNVDFMRLLDVDGDGDMDFIGEDDFENLAWWENHGSGSPTRHVLENIGGSTDYYWELSRADFNGDGRMDFVVTFVDQIFNGYNYYTSWWENTGTDELIKHPISNSPITYPLDVDGDGDMDLIALRGESAQNPDDNAIHWFENTGYINSDAHFFIHHKYQSTHHRFL